LNVVEKSLELPKDKSKRIKKSNIGHESSTSSRQNDVKVDEIDITLSKVWYTGRSDVVSTMDTLVYMIETCTISTKYLRVGKTFCFYSMHYVDNLYLVDQFEGFTIPDYSGQLTELLNIIEIMFTFKVIIIFITVFLS
jgi:hypothetical protein